jgi:hypothetical protein
VRACSDRIICSGNVTVQIGHDRLFITSVDLVIFSEQNFG